MNTITTNRLFLALFIFFSTNSSYGMEQALQSTVTDLIFNILLGDMSLLQMLVTQPDSPFMDLPQDMKNTVLQFIITGATGETLAESAKAINALSQVNTELNSLINDMEHTYNLVNHLAQRFNCSEEDVCNALQTKTAKEYLQVNTRMIQNVALEHTNQQENIFPYLLPRNINFRLNNVRYRRYDANSFFNPNDYIILIPMIPGGGNCIMELCQHSGINFLEEVIDTCPININLPNNMGRTALMITAINGDPAHVSLLLKKFPNININQQDYDGNTALLHALKTSETIQGVALFKFAWHNTVTIPHSPYALTIKVLLDAGADPELPNLAGLTPLQAVMNLENSNLPPANQDQIIQLIKDAIKEKYRSSNSP